MADAHARGSAPQPRWDGRRVLFEVDHDGEEVSCAVSPDALRELTSQRFFKPKEVLASFTGVRRRVEEIARNKLRARGAPVTALLTVWSDDIEDYGPATRPTA